jgi:ATP-dependent HslUV protease subunit HslV
MPAPEIPRLHGTTILSVRRAGKVAVGGDGQVTLGDCVVKQDAVKIRRIGSGQVLAGFAGAVGDSLALLDRFEEKLLAHGGNLLRAAVELSRDWRTDRVLRRLESMLVAVDAEHSLLLSGSGEVIQPSDGILAIGSGGNYARAAAVALAGATELSAEAIVRRSLEIAGDLCVYSNRQIAIEVLP